MLQPGPLAAGEISESDNLFSQWTRSIAILFGNGKVGNLLNVKMPY